MCLSLTIVMLASILIIPLAKAEGSGSADSAVLALISAFSDARAHVDATALDAILTPDYVEVSPCGEVDRRPAVLGFYKSDKGTRAPPITLGTQDVRRYGDNAIVIGSVEYAVPGPSGTTINRTLPVTYVERRIGGRWLMASTQYTGVQPPKPTL